MEYHRAVSPFILLPFLDPKRRSCQRCNQNRGGHPGKMHRSPVRIGRGRFSASLAKEKKGRCPLRASPLLCTTRANALLSCLAESCRIKPCPFKPSHAQPYQAMPCHGLTATRIWCLLSPSAFRCVEHPWLFRSRCLPGFWKPACAVIVPGEPNRGKVAYRP